MRGWQRGTESWPGPAQATYRIVAAMGLAITLAACAESPAPESGMDPTTRFPLGVYSRIIERPETGRMRLDWVFGPDGRWAEIPIALDGQTQSAPVVRGTYRVDGDMLTIATTWPPHWGTSQHRWRMDGDALRTVFVASDIPEDADWFTSMDSTPWRPRS